MEPNHIQFQPSLCDTFLEHLDLVGQNGKEIIKIGQFLTDLWTFSRCADEPGANRVNFRGRRGKSHFFQLFLFFLFLANFSKFI